MNDDFIKRVDEVVEVMKTPLGRALMEKEALRSFKKFGLDFTGEYEADAVSTSRESSADEMSVDGMDVDKMSIDEPENMQPELNTPVSRSAGKEPANPSISVSQPDGLSNSDLAISKSRAKRWLESI